MALQTVRKLGPKQGAEIPHGSNSLRADPVLPRSADNVGGRSRNKLELSIAAVAVA